MLYFGAWTLLYVILIVLQSGTLMGNQHSLPTKENSHKSSGELGNMEGEAYFNFKAFLENLKADFLRNLNLSVIPSQEKIKEKPPQFMIDLYNRYTQDKSSSPIANIVRSFRPEDISSLSSLEMNQKYILLFNVSIPWHEEVTKAELRIHIACQKEAECFPCVHGNVVIYDVHEGHNWEEAEGVKNFLASREIQGCGWVTFDVSSTVKKWVKAEKTRTVNRLETAVKSYDPSGFNCEHLNISVAADSNHLPSLIVFSNDHGKRVKASHAELQEMVAHEQEDMLKSLAKDHAPHRRNSWPVHGTHHSLSRNKRSIELNHCRKTTLHVNFKEIGWNWIIAPPDYEAFQCKGGCFYPLTDNVTPTKHAIVQTLVHYKNPKKAVKACCVPTKLEAISMLYKDEAGTPTLKYEYEGMKVAECGCR
ncbi:dorsalin-1 [Pantherophis guttatus]|uniref:Dorsalin-1 n=1 Tax=Pantherophis guttatus TaxID=94885 RepID=A0A6P9C8V5_PANGU|nr:dorsalin-1 [Pantherophis guttatus]